MLKALSAFTPKLWPVNLENPHFPAYGIFLLPGTNITGNGGKHGLEITAFHCLCDDFLISKGWRDDQRCVMSAAEVMTAAAFFSGGQEKSCSFLEEHGYMPATPSKSRFSCRLGGIPEQAWTRLLRRLAGPFHEADSLKIYLMDSFFLPAAEHPHETLQNISGWAVFGVCVTPWRVFLWPESSCADDWVSAFLRKYSFYPGSYADVNALHDFFHVPSGSAICGGRAYDAYAVEDGLSSQIFTWTLPGRKIQKENMKHWPKTE
jgi:hypothetical protein